MKVLLDTNFIVDCFRYRIDMKELFELVPRARLATVPQVIMEIKTMAGRKTSTHGKYARVAAKLIDGIEVLDSPKGKADDALVYLSDREHIVATNDEKLRRRIHMRGFKTIYLRGRKELSIK